MVSIFSPRFPTQPSPAGATVATTQFPTELAPFIKDILEKSKAQQEGAAYQAYTGPQLAQFTDAERAAMDAMRQQTTGLAGTDVAQATPYFTGAKTAAEQLGEQFTGDTAQQFMNPYQQAVVDQAKRKAIEDYEQVTAPTVTAQAIAQQPFGGSRQAIAEAMAREGLADRLTEIQERGLSDAFTQGRAAFEAQKARELQQAQQLAQLGQTVPQQALRDLAVQQQLGEQERQQEQLALDLAKGQFMEEREFPTRALQEYSAIVRGFPFQPSTYQTSTQYQATPSVASQLLQLGGTGLGAYTAFTGKNPGALFGFGAAQGGGIADIISNQMGMNQQMQMNPFENKMKLKKYEDSAKGDAEEHLNRYGVGGTERREVEDLLPSDLLPEEVAPFRTDEVMTESAVGAPPGPLPSREEIDMMERNRLLEEEQMRRMFNQGGLVSLPTVYRNQGNQSAGQAAAQRFQSIFGKGQEEREEGEQSQGEDMADAFQRFISSAGSNIGSTLKTMGQPYVDAYLKYIGQPFASGVSKVGDLLNKLPPIDVQDNKLYSEKYNPNPDPQQTRGGETVYDSDVGPFLQKEIDKPEVPTIIEDPKVEAENLTSDADVGGLNLEGTTVIPSGPDLSGDALSAGTAQNVGMPTDIIDKEGLKVKGITYTDPRQTALDEFDTKADAYSKLLAQLGSKEEMDRRRADAEEAKNRDLGFAMMKAFGDPLDPTLSFAQQLTARGKKFSEDAEPGMEKYREELQEIEDLPLSVAAQQVSLAKDKVDTGDKLADRALSVLETNKNIEASNISNLMDFLKTKINLDVSNRDHQQKVKELEVQIALANDKNAIDLYGIGMNYAAASDANKLKYAKHLKDLQKAGDVTTQELKAVQQAVATKVFGGEDIGFVFNNDGEVVLAGDIPAEQSNDLLNKYRSIVAAVTNQFGINKKLYQYSGGQQGADPLQTIEGDINDITDNLGAYDSNLKPMRNSSDPDDKKIIEQFDRFKDKYPGTHIDVVTTMFLSQPEIIDYYTQLGKSLQQFPQS